jgi:hypothetical protein
MRKKIKGMRRRYFRASFLVMKSMSRTGRKKMAWILKEKARAKKTQAQAGRFLRRK